MSVDISKPAGNIKKSGYIEVRINRQSYQLHRLIYIFHKGGIPEGCIIDHSCGNNTNNKIENLQPITQHNNMIKMKKFVTNKSGYRGVSKFRNKWRTHITINNKQIHIGIFENVQDAARAYDKAAMEYHGEFAQLNFLE